METRKKSYSNVDLKLKIGFKIYINKEPKNFQQSIKLHKFQEKINKEDLNFEKLKSDDILVENYKKTDDICIKGTRYTIIPKKKQQKQRPLAFFEMQRDESLKVQEKINKEDLNFEKLKSDDILVENYKQTDDICIKGTRDTIIPKKKSQKQRPLTFFEMMQRDESLKNQQRRP